MSPSDNQIVQLYEIGEMSIESIAQGTGYEIEVVKKCLLSNSERYKAKYSHSNIEDGEEITALEFANIKRGMFELAQTDLPELAPTKFKALQFLWNEKKGRNESPTAQGLNALAGVMSNIALLNNGLLEAKNAVRKSLGHSQIIEVNEVPIEHEKAVA